MQFKFKFIIAMMAGLLVAFVDFYPFEGLLSESLPASDNPKANLSHLSIIQDNTILPSHKIISDNVKIEAILTGYSSDVWETDDTPYITASGERVKWGIVANNKLPFGTKIKIPELFGDTIFVVEDRMSPLKRDNQVDIWFPSASKANIFGVHRAYIEILKS